MQAKDNSDSAEMKVQYQAAMAKFDVISER